MLDHWQGPEGTCSSGRFTRRDAAWGPLIALAAKTASLQTEDLLQCSSLPALLKPTHPHQGRTSLSTASSRLE